jgi:hypothetical protein
VQIKIVVSIILAKFCAQNQHFEEAELGVIVAVKPVSA